MDASTTEIPWWVAALLVPGAVAFWGWWKTDGWPWIRSLWSAEARIKREAAKTAATDREERFLTAYEQAAKALVDLARSGEASAQALRVAAETRVLDNLTLQRVERRLDAIEDVVGRAPPIVRARARGRTEGEQGE